MDELLIAWAIEIENGHINDDSMQLKSIDN
jgi:hypothetical protein